MKPGRPHNLMHVGLLATVIVLLLTWLNLRAQAVSPELHFAYTQNLRDLREFNSRIDNELLSSRLERARNYDDLTRYTQSAQQTAIRTAYTPDFLSDTDRRRIEEAGRQLQESLARKADLIDQFKRSNAVLRNSMAYFIAGSGKALEVRGRGQDLPALHWELGLYTRQVLAYASAPSPEEQNKVVQAATALLSAMRADGRRWPQIDIVLRHGDIITSHIAGIETLMQRISELRSDERVDSLNQIYTHAQARAHAVADRYREALYLLDILLTGFLAWLFLRLEFARRSLAQAHHEVSERYAAQLCAEQQLSLHATAFRNAHDGITLTDARGVILDVNPAFSRITGWARDEVIGHTPRILKSGHHDEDFYVSMWRKVHEEGSWHGEIWNRNKVGEIYPELLSISQVRDATGAVTNYVAVFSDIGRIKSQEKQLIQMAYFDALTELPNRKLLADRLAQGIAQSRRSGLPMAVCYLDLDGFKPINDTWGHEAGDRVLVEMANRLKAALRGGDTVARLGGDEFALLLLGLADQRECEEAARRIIRVVSEPLVSLGSATAVSASLGITLFPSDEEDPDTLLRHADQAMYQAKQSGKNCFRLFNTAQDRSTRQMLDHMARIGRGLRDGEFVLHYQPQVDMRRGVVVGAEALIRWEHPERGLLSPAEFLPQILQDDLIKSVGDWVIETALQQMEDWHAQDLVLPVSVNIAARQLQAPEFVDSLRQAVGRHPVAARSLDLEILESAALNDIVNASQVIDECRSLGVHFSLDDFGVGYSSLSYLKRLPVKTIKIDQSFVRELRSDPNNLVIVQGITDLSRAFQRRVLAEGVESAELGRLLLQLNCDLAQGYGIARPMPAERVPEWIRSWMPPALWQDVRNLFWHADDYGVLSAEIQLYGWVEQVLRAMEQGGPVPHEHFNDPSQCCFGTWYDAIGRERYSQHEAFERIHAPHCRLHQIVDQMDRHWRNRQVEPMRALTGDLLSARDEVLAHLHELQLRVALARKGHKGSPLRTPGPIRACPSGLDGHAQ